MTGAVGRLKGMEAANAPFMSRVQTPCKMVHQQVHTAPAHSLFAAILEVLSFEGKLVAALP